MGNIAIRMELQTTLRGENFLAHDSEPGDSDRRLVFNTEANLDILEHYTTWHADGTFKSCRSLFFQVYTTHVDMITAPSQWFTTQQQYQEACRVLRELNILLEPTEIVIEFEKAAISAFKSEFPTA